MLTESRFSVTTHILYKCVSSDCGFMHHLSKMTTGGGAVLPLDSWHRNPAFPKREAIPGTGFFNHYCTKKVTAMMPEGDLYKFAKTSLENKFLWFLMSAISWKAA